MNKYGQKEIRFSYPMQTDPVTWVFSCTPMNAHDDDATQNHDVHVGVHDVLLTMKTYARAVLPVSAQNETRELIAYTLSVLREHYSVTLAHQVHASFVVDFPQSSLPLLPHPMSTFLTTRHGLQATRSRVMNVTRTWTWYDASYRLTRSLTSLCVSQCTRARLHRQSLGGVVRVTATAALSFHMSHQAGSPKCDATVSIATSLSAATPT